ncbi:hypothetical protein LPW26_06175 [Rhodopseudomonas sp. HC1]|uniref:hypothetical protein n=1 Tax=Rhodopseudomonas infernalis TaxID=2897386 RepID=UPI001EE81780|nr:hypothetical protein [Rhodopseudomonas infernalis]MCG6204214.1 hypothetical protein [Rhodopseudomonas infernalis]
MIFARIGVTAMPRRHELPQRTSRAATIKSSGITAVHRRLPITMDIGRTSGRIATKGIAVTKYDDDLASILEILERAVAAAERLKLPTLGYLLSMAVMEATEQMRTSEAKRHRA